MVDHCEVLCLVFCLGLCHSHCLAILNLEAGGLVGKQKGGETRLDLKLPMIVIS